MTTTTPTTPTTTTTTTPAFVGRRTGGPNPGPGYWARVTRARVPTNRAALARLAGRVTVLEAELSSAYVGDFSLEQIRPGLVRVDVWQDPGELPWTWYVTGAKGPRHTWASALDV